jgi:hypothetical protein
MARFEDAIGDDGRVQNAISWIRQSGYSIQFLADRLVIFAGNGAMAAECFDGDEILTFAKRQAPSHRLATPPVGGFVARGFQAGRPGDDPLRELEATNAYLRNRWRAAVTERNDWENRALAAEEELAKLKAADASGQDAAQKYKELKRLLAKELHPDKSGAPPEQREMRAELFKALWAEVSRLDKG